ncbi:MAG: hypothetical protein ACRDI2_21415, partial [Chloroflexota bacterium]
ERGRPARDPPRAGPPVAQPRAQAAGRLTRRLMRCSRKRQVAPARRRRPDRRRRVRVCRPQHRRRRLRSLSPASPTHSRQTISPVRDEPAPARLAATQRVQRQGQMVGQRCWRNLQDERQGQRRRALAPQPLAGMAGS